MQQHFSLNRWLLILPIVFISLIFSLPAQAASCKGKSRSSCNANNSCTWVGAYKRSDGVKVSGHCRALPGKGVAKSSRDKAKAKNNKNSSSKNKSGKKDSTKKKKDKKSKKKKDKKKDTKKNKKKDNKKKNKKN